jgi:D-glycero-alpha-D-manno-heptose-7-phosphate kinase
MERAMIITQTPLRIGLVGGGTDLPGYSEPYGGLTLSAAIDKYIYVIVRRRFDDDIHLSYSRRESVSRVEDVQHELIREAMLLTGVTSGVDIVTLADIPSEGSGLGSSSTVTVGLLNALHAYQGRQVPAAELADQACNIEIYHCGKPIGRQDQYIAACGGIRAIRFGPGDMADPREVRIADETRSALQSQIMLFYTGVTRSANGILADHTTHIASNRSHLDQLRDLADFTIRRLAEGSVDEVGDAIREGWEAKKKLGGVTNPDIDRAVALALDAGASGAKISGAGAGGFLLVFCTAARQNDVRQALAPMREMPVRLDRYGTRVVLSLPQEIWS